jgi:hypothetical protein
MSIYKVLKNDLKHFDMQYKQGLNILNETWIPEGECQSGGLYATYNFPRYLRYGTKISRVVIPDEADMWTEDGYKLKTTSLILTNIEEISNANIDWKDLFDQDRIQFSDIPIRCRTNGIYLTHVMRDGTKLKCTFLKNVKRKKS